MKKKIIFFAPNIEDGGIEKNIILLGDYLVRNNYPVKIIYSRISHKIKKKLNNKIKLVKSDINFNYFFKERINNSINCFFFFLFKFNTEKNNIILSFQDHPFSIISGLLKRIPCLIRIANHPIGSLIYFNNKLNFLLKIMIKIFFYQFSDKIISNSISSTNFFKKYILKSDKCVTIYNPLKLEKNLKKFKRNKNILLSIGRLDRQKNFECMIKAFYIVSKKNKKIKLIILGKGRDKFKLVKLINELNLSKKIKFLNFQNPKKYYKNSGIFILSSFFEGLPNVLLESMNYGLPIVSTNCYSGPNEILKNNKYGYLCKVNNHFDLAKKILIANKNYKRALHKIELGRKKVFKFDYEFQCEKYLKIITSF